MISVARKARPRRSPNRVTLVDLDGTPIRPAESDPATWPAWTDNWYWEPGEGPHDVANHVAPLPTPEPDAPDGESGWMQLMVEASLPPVRIPGIDPEPEVESDAEFMARLAREEAAERDRVLATYEPLPEDLEEYAAWSEALDSGTLPPEASGRFTFGCYRGQVSDDEMAQLAAHGCI